MPTTRLYFSSAIIKSLLEVSCQLINKKLTLDLENTFCCSANKVLLFPPISFSESVLV